MDVLPSFSPSPKAACDDDNTLEGSRYKGDRVSELSESADEGEGPGGT